ncbi:MULTISPECIES: tripartite tricarboxylate transporter permease [unclassified Chelatococcus]|uniref:tripartite tricarboxylate transporter permease n=1 Tax=unclassified Chelatococcus TaxID=2638111 RepID=UPI001BCD766E|nr:MULTISPECIES: tripartite tricarboxylate transporter permease [unclassified Chelatococcus]MBS7743743.1 tripartite tricarboxylate transporter permease [Chelatococcus sp. HY11]MBX3547255.1 tripartite tricarboxylate transporter permease [Chelatococcus sp.]CAH1664844.1 Uncharacterized 52.8 kDa protein in TAR-I ttuC' 3'region [Hyphomicrobiales bacterium]CAH1688524.1 Uncharacterized 52.8 kDa protein in TAR-I ttuC' 3'region [Hyphomicrobiales bacterium]
MQHLLDNLMLGFSVAASPTNLLYCLLGTLLGTAIGVLPGIGPVATIALLLPFTLGLDSTTALIMLAGIYYGSQYGGSTTAILVNMPGEAASAITTIDGHQMAKKGRAGPALAAAAIGSFVAGTFATLLISVIAIPLTTLALSVGSPEYFSLLVLGLILSITLASGSVIKAIGMICLGLLLGLTGLDIYSGAPRFTFGTIELMDGFDFVAIAVGMFGLSEIFRNLEKTDEQPTTVLKMQSLWPTRTDFRRMTAPITRGTIIGSLLGVLPGGGALLSSFVAYTVEKRVSPNSAEFGRGAIEGVAAPEAANNAGAQTSFIPMLSLGIPSNIIMAFMVGSMLMQGITPGPGVINANPELFWGLIASMWIGNAMLVVLNLPLVGLWTSMLSLPYVVLFPAIVTFSAIGAFSVTNTQFSIFILAGAGLAGYILIKLDCELPPFILGFILGPMLEDHLRRSLIISGGDPLIFMQKPISAVLLLASAAILVFLVAPAVQQRRKEIFVEDG